MMFLPLVILLGEGTATATATVTEPELIRHRFTLTTICDVDYGLPLYNITQTSLPQCSTACAEEDACQSLTYDRRTRKCRLSAAESLNPTNTDCDKTVEYVTFSTEDQSTGCTDDSHCSENQFCDGTGHCACIWGFRYNPRDDTCSPGCAKYGSDFQQINDIRLGRHNDRKLDNVTADQAKALCIKEDTFTCISMECYKFENFCFISKDSIVTHFADLVSDVEYVYFQRKCS